MADDETDASFVEAMMRSTMEEQPMKVAIVCDDAGKWYVRRVRIVEHDLDRDEKVYRCDIPIGSQFDTLEAAAEMATLALQRP